ncbi:ImcF-related family protein [Caballeronia sp. GAWG1-1]|uniref:ImcF-related family protein n=1 Tax=Caballeronia sp. GAWG1-1 TaxID=2921742 RepID=UPI0020293EB9|nr:ImcF-related family protein [Caballeronia sp. GAWG1-1]
MIVSKNNLEEGQSENGQALLLWVAAGTLVAVACVIGFVGWEFGWGVDRLVGIGFGLLAVLLAVVASTLVVDRMALRARWISAATSQASATSETRKMIRFDPVAAARELVRLLEGVRHWRSRTRWLLVVGEKAVVDRFVPGLTMSRYAVRGDIVLLYANNMDDEPDHEWMERVRRLRRWRSIDAVAAIISVDDEPNKSRDGAILARQLARNSRTMRWVAPVYVVSVAACRGTPRTVEDAIGLTWSSGLIPGMDVEASLSDLATNLAGVGVSRLASDPRDRVIAELSQHIDGAREKLSSLVSRIAASEVWRNDVHGLLFAPVFSGTLAAQNLATSDVQARYPAVWRAIADHSRKVHGYRVGLSWPGAAAWALIAATAVWLLGSAISGAANMSAMQEAASTSSRVSSTQDPTQALLSLDALDKQLDTLEIRSKEGAPLYTRFGLNHDAALYQRLWPAYLNAASRVLIVPIKAKLENRLSQLASLSDAEIASGGNAQVQAAYDTLRTYLMLANPEHADATFLTTQLLATNEPARQQDATLTQGAWEDLRQHAIAFYASHLKHGASPALTPDAALIASARQTIIGVRGIQNSTDAIYQQIIDETKPKYPPLTLAGILGDHPSRGFFSTSATVPGVFTRAAWEERIPKAIDEASEHHTVAGDWVLSDAKADNTSPLALKAELRQRYFDDYSRAWAQFLNGIRWQDASSLSGTVDQLTLLGDPQRSPLVALMDAIVYQAGAGASTQTLSDSLITKAQQLVGADEKDPSKRAQARNTPLAEAFGPVLRLTGSDLGAAASANGKGVPQPVGDLSLPRYLERVTAMRLRTQQMMSSPDPDAMSRAAAQAMLQGKTSDIADSRDYASRVSASLGERWAGFGKLFEAPFDQTWQVVVRPASASLNDIWRTAILADWNRNFASRYPFADSDNDASLPDLARFLRLDNGVIAQFVATQLAGIIERQGDHWVAAQGANQGALTLDPAFLIALNKLTRVSTVMFPSGDAHVRFDLRGVPTPGVTEMTFVLAGRTFKYFNQQEEWMPFEWPGQSLENVTHLEWETAQGGLRSALDAQGRFGVIRLLERAKVTQQDSARYLLSWTPDQSQALPLSVQMRAEGGAGPLDVLVLRHFALPERVFLVNNPAKTKATSAASNPPPLPPGAFTAANQLGIPLPQGATIEMH